MTEADSSESAGSEKLVDDYEFLDFNNGGLFVQVHFRTFFTSGPKFARIHKNSNQFVFCSLSLASGFSPMTCLFSGSAIFMKSVLLQWAILIFALVAAQ